MPASAVRGRDTEVAVVAAFCTGVSEGPATLLVEGDPGIGKTSLLAAGLQQGLAAGPPCHVVSLAPTESERGLPFAALLDLCGDADEAVLAGLPAPQREALDVALQRIPAPAAPLEQLAVSLAVRGVLSAWATREPVLLVVDDAQWVDPSSAQVLAFALRRLRDVPVRAVLGRRTGLAGEGLEPGPPAGPDQSLRLVGLSAAALHDLLRERCGVELAAPALARLLDMTHGNPLHALEVVRALPPGGRLTAAPLAVPPSLTGLLAARLAQLSPDTRELLVSAAAATRPTVRLLESVGDGLGEALAAGVLALDAAGEQVTFSHPLLAAGAYASVTDSRRREVHRRLAELTDDPDQRLQHRALGAAAPDAGLADELEASAARARARGAITAAGELLEHAERLAPTADAERRARRRITAAVHHEEAGDPGRAEQLLRELIPALPAGPTRAAALSGLAGVVPVIETALSLLEQAGAEAGDDLDLAARIVAQVQMYKANQRGFLDEDLPPRHDAMAAAEARGDSAGWAEFATGVLFQEVVTGHGADEQLVTRIEQAYDAWRPPRFFGLASESVGVLVAMVLHWTDHVDEADRWLARERRALREVRRPTVLGLALLRSAEVDLRRGDYPAAERHAREWEELVRPIPQELAICEYVNAFVAAHLGRVEEARTRATRGRELAGEAGDVAHQCHNEMVLAFVALSLEEWETAHRHYETLMPVVDEMFAEPSIVPAWSDDAEALIALGRLAEAERLIDRLEERGRTLQRTWALAAGARGRGLLLAAGGDLDGAEACLRGTLQDHVELVDPLGRGRTLLALGGVLRRARRKADAKQTLDEALAVFAGLGAELWRARAERELARIGLRPAAAAPVGTGLTEAEERVAELVVTGLTNREVAARLYMSPKTVEAHLSHVYRKLQLNTRTELAHKLRT